MADNKASLEASIAEGWASAGLDMSAKDVMLTGFTENGGSATTLSSGFETGYERTRRLASTYQVNYEAMLTDGEAAQAFSDALTNSNKTSNFTNAFTAGAQARTGVVVTNAAPSTQLTISQVIGTTTPVFDTGGSTEPKIIGGEDVPMSVEAEEDGNAGAIGAVVGILLGFITLGLGRLLYLMWQRKQNS